MTDQRVDAIRYARKNKQQFLHSLQEILAIPSISTDPAHDVDIRRAAEWLAAQLKSLGMHKVQIFPSSKHPIVYGEWLKKDGAPTILIYGHYDVQPVDPLSLWKTPPFEPVVRSNELFARGASDMKGQALVMLKAVESLVQTGGLPVNIKWLFEGEEEVGSPNLESFISTHKSLLACDFAINPDSGMLGKKYPTLPMPYAVWLTLNYEYSVPLMICTLECMEALSITRLLSWQI